ncbi:MAG: hypothetical protein KA501_10425 [Bacteroidia bacterium]|nr:hypothetical protein [Bacteroidia bacterium]
MKTTLVALATLLFSMTTVTENPIDRLGVKGPLVFNKTNFNLSWTDKPNESYFIQEYLPEGEKADSFNQMLTIHLFNTDVSTKEAVAQKIKELNARKKTDAVCNYEVNESPDGKEFIIDFLLGESKNDRMTIVEFNVYRYKKIEVSKNRKAVVVYAYSKRSYGDGITEFFKTLKQDRISFLNQMISADLPAVIIGSN